MFHVAMISRIAQYFSNNPEIVGEYSVWKGQSIQFTLEDRQLTVSIETVPYNPDGYRVSVQQWGDMFSTPETGRVEAWIKGILGSAAVFIS